jgi:hypothetical protein
MYIACPCLQFAIHVVGDPEEIQSLLGDESPHAEARCPLCRKALSRAPHLDSELAPLVQDVLRDLSPVEAHLVLEGMGFPDERDCVAEIVKALLVNQRVRSVAGHTLRGTARTAIDSITMEDGTTLFFGASSIVYRVRKPNPFMSKEVL